MRTILGALGLAGFYVLFFGAFAVLWLVCAVDRLLPLPTPWPRTVSALARRQRWCVARLRAAGAVPDDAVVTTWSVTPFRAGEALRSSLATIDLQWERGDDRGCIAAVAKLSPRGGSLANRAIYVLQGNHQREVGFYRRLAADAPAPRVYWARATGLTGHQCILMERLPAPVEHREEDGCPVAAATRALEQLARFHAAVWGREDRFPPPLPDVAIRFFASLAPGRRRRTLRHLARQSWRQGNTPQTVIHGDARVGNVLFPNRGEDAPVLIDWQALRWGRGAFDVAYFIALSLRAQDRREHELQLLERYHRALVAGGVADYDLDALREDYRHAQVMVGSVLVLPFLSGEITADAEAEARAVAGGVVWTKRLVEVAMDLDASWLEDRYGVTRAELRDALRDALLDPPRLNRGARLVANHLRESGEITALLG